MQPECRDLLQGKPHVTGLLDDMMKQHSVFEPKRVEALQLLDMMNSITDHAEMFETHGQGESARGGKPMSHPGIQTWSPERRKFAGKKGT